MTRTRSRSRKPPAADLSCCPSLYRNAGPAYVQGRDGQAVSFHAGPVSADVHRVPGVLIGLRSGRRRRRTRCFAAFDGLVRATDRRRPHLFTRPPYACNNDAKTGAPRVRAGCRPHQRRQDRGGRVRDRDGLPRQAARHLHLTHQGPCLLLQWRWCGLRFAAVVELYPKREQSSRPRTITTPANNQPPTPTPPPPPP